MDHLTTVPESPPDLAARLGLKIQDMLLLSRALTHRSYLNEHAEALEDNERLEYLGDAVLDFAVGVWLYNNFPEMAEGELTRMRSALVHTEQLANFARDLNIGDAMRLGRGELQAGGKDRSALLCDTFEALVGALYLDAGMQAVNDFMHPLLKVASDDILLHHKNEDPKSMLQEWAQSQGFRAPVYVTKNAFGPDHSKTFELEVLIAGETYGSGVGPSKSAAAKSAARQALQKIGIGHG
ncbi:MAG TPA: ribonuclease III [Bellilinea sp.]|nr:ribonuclease III [Bellilinea sp.]